MIEFFDTISTYIDQFFSFLDTVTENITQAVSTVKTWFGYLPAELLAIAGIAIVLIVIFRILGR